MNITNIYCPQCISYLNGVAPSIIRSITTTNSYTVFPIYTMLEFNIYLPLHLVTGCEFKITITKSEVIHRDRNFIAFRMSAAQKGFYGSLFRDRNENCHRNGIIAAENGRQYLRYNLEYVIKIGW